MKRSSLLVLDGALPCDRRHAGCRAAKIPDQAGQGARSVRSGRRQRHRRQNRRRAVAATARSDFHHRQQAGRVRHRRDRGNGPRQARRLHAAGRQRQHQWARARLHAKKYSIDYEKDTVPIARLTDTPLFLLAGKDYPAKTFAEFIADAKQRPGKVRYASVGIGAANHLDMEMLAKQAGIELIHVPNKGGAGASINDLVNGDVHVSFLNAASSVAMVKAGQIRPLAVAGDRRLAGLSRCADHGRTGHARCRNADLGQPARTRGDAARDPRTRCTKPCSRRSTRPPPRRHSRNRSSRPCPPPRSTRRPHGSGPNSRSGERILGEVKIDLTE